MTMAACYSQLLFHRSGRIFCSSIHCFEILPYDEDSYKYIYFNISCFHYRQQDEYSVTGQVTNNLSHQRIMNQDPHHWFTKKNRDACRKEQSLEIVHVQGGFLKEKTSEFNYQNVVINHKFGDISTM